MRWLLKNKVNLKVPYKKLINRSTRLFGLRFTRRVKNNTAYVEIASVYLFFFLIIFFLLAINPEAWTGQASPNQRPNLSLFLMGWFSLVGWLNTLLDDILHIITWHRVEKNCKCELTPQLIHQYAKAEHNKGWRIWSKNFIGTKYLPTTADKISNFCVWRIHTLHNWLSGLMPLFTFIIIAALIYTFLNHYWFFITVGCTSIVWSFILVFNQK